MTPATATFILLLAVTAPSIITAAPDPVMEYCMSAFGCPEVFKLLDPCGGGASNSILQQDYIYTPTPSLGACQCNSPFFNAFSSCLACIKSQGKSEPEIQNQQDWVRNCKSYGFDFTLNPIANATHPALGLTTGASTGLSKGAIAGIVVGVVVLLALIGATLFLRKRKSKPLPPTPLETPFTGGTDYVPPTTGTTVPELVDNYHNPDYSDSNYSPYQQTSNHHHPYDANRGSTTYQQDPYLPHQYQHQQQQQQQQQQPYQDAYYNHGQSNNVIMMQPMNQTAYVPPPPQPLGSSSPNTAAAVAAAAAAVNSTPSSPRPSDSFPQSLRGKSSGWSQQPPKSGELTSGLVVDPTQRNYKTEYESGDEALEPPPPPPPPRSRELFTRGSNEFGTSARPMTPPGQQRVGMQSYRDDLGRPSVEREIRLGSTGSDRGSISGHHLARGHGNESTSALNGQDNTGEESPEFARRRARAAELFAAESGRK
ncbi:hypothetical protein BGZ94_007835 [Podila epigama]|nr:hypothetical protein BGZ94_007835 [Podila epigama]